MSVQAIAWAFDQDIPCARKFVLVALANYAAADGTCWPSQRTIARLCGLSRQHVNLMLGELEASGHIAHDHRMRNDGAQTSNLYRLACHTICGGGVSDDDTPLSATMTGGVGQADTFKNEPSLEPSKNEISDAHASAPMGTIASFSESDFLSDDGKVRLTAKEIAEIEHDLPALTNVRGHIRQAFRNYAHLVPGRRVEAVRNFLMKKDREAASRAVDLAKRRKSAEKEKATNGRARKAGYGDEWM